MMAGDNNDDELPPAGRVSLATGMRALYLKQLKRSGQTPPASTKLTPIQDFGPPPLPEFDGPVEVVFSISEESDAGGSSYCWVERRGDDFVLFGNELGPMSGLCPDPITALTSSGTEFGMDYVDIKSKLSDEDLRDACRNVILSNVSRLTINGVEIDARDQDSIVSEYQSKASVS